jgi:predicted RNA methylase
MCLGTGGSSPLMRIANFLTFPKISRNFETVMMNPPFGTRKAGIDWTFLETAFKAADVVYSLHKSSTREYLLAKAGRDCGFEGEVVAEMKFDLPRSYKFHKKESLDIAVDLLRFERREG